MKIEYNITGSDSMTKYEKGSIVKGSVTGIKKYGVFVNLDNYYSGLIHISEISHNFVSDINNYVNLGDKINVKVVDVDDDSFHVKLSIKDIDYLRPENKVVKIKEVGSGFDILRDNLDLWIEKKLVEMDSEKL